MILIIDSCEDCKNQHCTPTAPGFDIIIVPTIFAKIIILHRADTAYLK